MNCPKCGQDDFNHDGECAHCQFSGDPALIEELDHVNWLLAEIDSWEQTEDSFRDQIAEKYQAQKRSLEIELELRLQQFSDEEAIPAWQELSHLEELLAQLENWQQDDLLVAGNIRSITDQLEIQIHELFERLEGRDRPEEDSSETNRLETIAYILNSLEDWLQEEIFKNAQSKHYALKPLRTEKESLKIILGLRKPPEPDIEPPTEEPAAPETLPPSPRQRRAYGQPPKPKLSLRERFWRSLLSERTLHAILFLGIFLLFSAAVSFVVWGWKDFPPPVRVAIPMGFTLLFFALGWIVRTKTNLYRSGIAISAIAALLIPIDLYTIYANYGSPPTNWAEFWLITSILCLGAYILATLNIQSRFFGYLVGVAAGSTVLACIELGHQGEWATRDMYSAGVSILAFLMLLLTIWLSRVEQPGRWGIFIEPSRNLSLLAVGITMPLTFGWRYLERETFDALHTALTINWWIGGFIFGWGAVQYKSRGLGVLAASSLPVAVYLAQAATFDNLDINPAWHAFGLAWLVLLYFWMGYHLIQNSADTVTQSLGRTANRWGLGLLLLSALWSLTNLASGASAASTHIILAGAVILAAILWKRPNYLFGASALVFSSATFAMTELELSIPQLGVGWASLAIVQILIALKLGNEYSRPLVFGGFISAALALFPPLFPYDSDLVLYSLGNWLGLSAWGAYLSRKGQRGFILQSKGMGAIFHWFTAIPLPVWIWLAFINRRPADFSLSLGLAALSWGMLGLSLVLNQLRQNYRTPWRLTAILVSVGSTVAAFFIIPDGLTPALCLMSAGLLYFVDAFTAYQSGELAPAGLVSAWGLGLLLYRLNLESEPIYFALGLLVLIYFIAGLWVERRRSAVFTFRFLSPLYWVAHILAAMVIFWVYIRALAAPDWTDEMKIWGAVTLIILGGIYGVFAWSRNESRWAHLGIWLFTAGGGFVAILLSSGRGRSAVWAALGATVYIIAERALNGLRSHPSLLRRQRAYGRIAWNLYKQPLLVAGWTVSAAAIFLALVRNLLILEGGRVQQTWAVIALLILTGLYSLSAKLFSRVRFVWFAALLIIAPWTLLTNLGWFTPYRLTVPGFAVSWMLLAWALFLVSLWVTRRFDENYAQPLKVVTNLLIPFSLLWAIADAQGSRYTFGLAIGFYNLAAFLWYRRAKTSNTPFSPFAVSKYLYPGLSLIPIWCVYWIVLWLPRAQHEVYGIMFLAFGASGLIVGRWLQRIAPRVEIKTEYALPGYLSGYAALIVGIMLVAHIAPLLALALIYVAALMLISARIFRNSLWIYPTSVLVPISLLITLTEINIPPNRQGWWLIGLAATYLILSWLLRRTNLTAYSTGTLGVAFALIAFALPPSSQDQIGAIWGYAGAALLYVFCAFWLRQPLLLIPACALASVPYALGLQRSVISPEYYGLALFPGAILALAAGWFLDRHFGDWRDFPWTEITRWPEALAQRLLEWWALPLYALGFGLAGLSPIFTDGQAQLTALNFLLLLGPLLWAVYRFRLRIWLVGAILSAHLGMVYFLQYLGWWQFPAQAWLRFTPVTTLTLLLGLSIERRRGEGSPLELGKMFSGWSRPFYGFAFADILIAQLATLDGGGTGALVSLIHTMIFVLLASIWTSKPLAFLAAGLGAVALGQWLTTLTGPIEGLPYAYALLALGYGIIGYGIEFWKTRNIKVKIPQWLQVFQSPYQMVSLLVSAAVLAITFVLGVDLIQWTVRAIFGFSFREIVALETVRMAVQVSSIIGLLYMSMAVVRQKTRLGYIAGAMLLSGWLLYAFYIQQWAGLARVQWYAVPAGLYLIGIAFLEWQRGNQPWARWLDYAGIALMFGSLFWQTMILGWKFALLLGSEGLVSLWWGSARRLRRFFYAGILGVVMATVGQLVNALQAINQWITFGIIGSLLVLIAVIVERRMENFKVWQESMEDWE